MHVVALIEQAGPAGIGTRDKPAGSKQYKDYLSIKDTAVDLGREAYTWCKTLFSAVVEEHAMGRKLGLAGRRAELFDERSPSAGS